MGIWLTADLHFNHEQIITLAHRDWAPTVDYMNQAMIDNWNAHVAPTDTVYVLGDFAFSMKRGWPLLDIFRQLRGHKHLVIGNHDERNKKVLRLPWESQRDLVTIRHSYAGVLRRVIACHYPLETWKNAHHGYVHAHGHSHGTMQRIIPRRYDVGIDPQEVCPVNIETVLSWADSESYIAQDHHIPKSQEGT